MKDDLYKTPLVDGKIVSRNVVPTDYHAENIKRGHKDYVMSRSELVEFSRCPHRWVAGYEPHESTAELEWGSMLDCAVLTPDDFEKRHVIRPDVYPSEKGEKPWHNGATYCKDWNAQHIGKRIISREDDGNVREAVKRLHDDEAIMRIIGNSDAQVVVTALYEDRDTKLVVPLKAMIDLVPDGNLEFFNKCLVDLKTTTSANPRRWQRTVFDFGYHVQAALYLDAYNAATNEDRTDFLHIVQENFAPWETGRRLLSAEFIELGRMTYLESLRRYCQCLETGVWPGYDDMTQGIGGWTLTQPEPWMVAS